MNTRIKKIRKENRMTQDEFAAELFLTRNYISLIENGDRAPSDRTISDICQKFSVNEEWLRHGTGDPHIPVPDEFAAYVEDLLSDDDNPLYDIIRGTMQTYHGLDAKSKEVVKEFCRELIVNLKKMS